MPGYKWRWRDYITTILFTDRKVITKLVKEFPVAVTAIPASGDNGEQMLRLYSEVDFQTSARMRSFIKGWKASQ